MKMMATSQCFVCSKRCEGDRSLCQAKTVISLTPYPQCLGQILGEKYTIVMSLQDQICAECSEILEERDQLLQNVKLIEEKIHTSLQAKFRICEDDETITCEVSPEILHPSSSKDSSVPETSLNCQISPEIVCQPLKKVSSAPETSLQYQEYPEIVFQCLKKVSSVPKTTLKCQKTPKIVHKTLKTVSRDPGTSHVAPEIVYLPSSKVTFASKISQLKGKIQAKRQNLTKMLKERQSTVNSQRETKGVSKNSKSILKSTHLKQKSKKVVSSPTKSLLKSNNYNSKAESTNSSNASSNKTCNTNYNSTTQVKRVLISELNTMPSEQFQQVTCVISELGIPALVTSTGQFILPKPTPISAIETNVASTSTNPALNYTSTKRKCQKSNTLVEPKNQSLEISTTSSKSPTKGISKASSQKSKDKVKEKINTKQKITAKKIHKKNTVNKKEVKIQSQIIANNSNKTNQTNIEVNLSLPKSVPQNKIDIRLKCILENCPNNVCFLCNKKFENSTLLINHVNNHKISEAKICKYCGIPVRSIKIYLKHLTCHKDSNITCTICGKSNLDQEMLKLHISKVHKHNRSCDFCSEQFTDKKTLEKHVETHIKVQFNACVICDRTFKCRKFYIHHIKLHKTIKTNVYDCPHCEDTLKQIKTFNKHVRSHFANKHERGKGDCLCSICGNKFSNKNSLSIHMSQHTGIFKYYCSTCKKGFNTKTKLKEHEELHKKPEDRNNFYTCDICGKQFRQQGSFSTHRKWHENPYPAECPYCGLKGRYKRLMQIHINEVHLNLKPYKCNLCTESFSRSEKLRRHKTEHGIFKYKCCGLNFRRKRAYNLHNYKVHDIPIPTQAKKQFDCDFSMIVPGPAFIMPENEQVEIEEVNTEDVNM